MGAVQTALPNIPATFVISTSRTRVDVPRLMNKLELISVLRPRRYTNGMKNLALSLFYKGPKAYNFLSSIFTLPSKASLHLWLHRLSVPTGISNDVLNVLQRRVNDLNDRDRVCALLIDEMSLKTNLSYDRRMDIVVGYADMGIEGERTQNLANSALVFMIRGLALNWKQLLGYVLTESACKEDSVQTLLLQCIDSLRSI